MHVYVDRGEEFNQCAGRRVEIHASFYYTHHPNRSNTSSPRNKCDGQFAWTPPPQVAGGVINLINEITARELSSISPHDINIRKVTDPYFFLNLICTYNKPCPVHLLF